MKIKVTNKLNLPDAFVIAIENDPYDPDDGGQHSDYTITGLLKPPRMAVLSTQHEIIEDASERLYSLQGQIIHYILERAKPTLAAKGFIVEERFYKEYVVDGKSYLVSAKVDVYDPAKNRLSDYKYTSVAAANKGLKEEHRLQVNFQARLLRHEGYSVNDVDATADATLLLRDWSAMREYEGYPKSPCMVHNVPLMSDSDVDAFVVERIRLHEAAKAVLPECSEGERWQRNTYAVMKNCDAAKAVSGGVKDTLEEAEEVLKKHPEGLIETRVGKSTRCTTFCPVRTVCEQGKKYREDQEVKNEVDADGFVKVT